MEPKHRPVMLFTVLGSVMLLLSRLMAGYSFFASAGPSSGGNLWGATIPLVIIGLGFYALAAYNRVKNASDERCARYGLATGKPGSGAPASDFDADAVMARYLAQRAAPAPSPEPAPPPASGPAPHPLPVAGTRPSFGRKRG